MGLKSGSQGSGLDDDDDESEAERIESPPADGRRSEPDRTPSQDRTTVSEDESDDHPSSDDDESYPYKLRRSNVNDDRQQVPFFLRGHVLDAEQELKNDLEERLGETVYKSDYREAAMLHAQRNPEDIEKILREWGYDL
jgi:hypothetical protein